MNVSQKVGFAVFLATATSTSYATPYTNFEADGEINHAIEIEADYLANPPLLDQLSLRQQVLIERLEANNQIEFDQQVDLERLHEALETHSTTK